MEGIENAVVAAADFMWGPPLVLLLSGGGLYFMVVSGALPLRLFGHSLGVLSGKHDKAGDPGLISHYKALSVALAATIGMGNIAGVALAISIGGPGAVFWMWISAILGMATKYFTCTLAVMFRGPDKAGELQGGPMYVIREGMGKGFVPLAWVFCVAGMVGCLPIFNANQLTSATVDILYPAGLDDPLMARAGVGVVLCGVTAIVVLGGLKRIANAVSALVPAMVVVYMVSVGAILIAYADEVPRYLALIVTDAFAADFFKGDSVLGGALGGLIMLGARRAAFSNEAGLGTAAMAHGAAKTSEPVQEGLVAMLGPVIDTLLVCTLTALAILVTGVWQEADGIAGVTLTLSAFETALPGIGGYLLLVCILAFGMSSLFSYNYFGTKCFGFLFNPKHQQIYNVVYVATILFGAVQSVRLIVNLIDFSFALMAVPTMISAIWLSPKVVAETRAYAARRRARQAEASAG